MNLTGRQQALFDWVKSKHGTQKRKYTEEPYWYHLINVSEIAGEFAVFGFEIGICHDLIEDTDCNLPELLGFLLGCGYDENESLFITSGVNDLTDKFTPKKYPLLNRMARKEKEAKRMQSICANSQTIKYADLIDNTSSIVERDPGFAKVYLEEKKLLLSLMTEGSIVLRSRCMEGLYTNTHGS